MTGLRTDVEGAVESGVVLGDIHLDAAQFSEDVARTANALRAEGISSGDRVVLLMYNDIPYLVASVAASKIGAAPAAINWHNTPEHIGNILQDAGAKMLIAHPNLFDQVRHVVPEGVIVVLVTPSKAIADAHGLDAGRPSDSAPAVRDWTPWLADQPAALADARTSALDVTIMPDTVLFTSGTTGRSKGVRRLASTPGPEAMKVAGLIGLRPGIRHVVTGPLYHAAPGGMALHVVHLGGLAVIQPRFDAEDLLRLIEHHRITNLMLVPTMLVRILDLPDHVQSRYDLSSLECVVHAAGPCPIRVKEAAIRLFGAVVCEYYGGTETGVVTFCNSSDSLAKPGTVGRAAPGVTLRILAEDGKDVSPGTVGEIFIRNTGVPDFEYIGNAEARTEIERDGFVTQGDLGYIDDDGYLFLAGRRREMIVSGGVNLYTIEIENLVSEIPGVRMGAAFPVPDDEFGEVVGLAVELDGTAQVTREQVRDAVGGGLGYLKAPRVVQFDQTLSTNESGKVFKQQLAAKYAGATQIGRDIAG
ncbi:MAG: o-succinylbenzoate--CoA ligase [Streptosporangiaceae bacterium]|nr:o-succinylbenzoate--CoA ligase [Streptosporangiaceae bacterium]